MFDRRTFLGRRRRGAALLLAAPRLAVAQAATDRRFVFIIQRGAADGLGTLAPTGDPAFAGAARRLRAGFRRRRPARRLLHAPSEPRRDRRGSIAAREALFVHAVASPYRDRSHFDGQNVLETGGHAAYALRDGWMNRLLGLLPRGEARAIAVSATVPMVLRGSREVASYAPSALPDASDDLLARVAALYERRPAAPFRLGAGDADADHGRRPRRRRRPERRRHRRARGAAAGGRGGRADRGDRDRRLGHPRQPARPARLPAARPRRAGRRAEDRASARTGRNTLVLVATEFGRTAAPNGTGGTDHGTASLAMLLGGAVAGGRVHRRLAGPRRGRAARRPRPQADARSRRADRQRRRPALPARHGADGAGAVPEHRQGPRPSRG